MRYAFDQPPGWTQVPVPDGQAGLLLRAVSGPGRAALPVDSDARILFLEPIYPDGDLSKQLEVLVEDGCRTASSVKKAKVADVRSSRGHAGAAMAVTCKAGKREEQRVFALIDLGGQRLPVVYIGGAQSLRVHQATLDAVLSSVSLARAPYWHD